jgi:hypothetical protein
MWHHVVSGTPLLRYISRPYYMQNLASFPRNGWSLSEAVLHFWGFVLGR